MSTFIGNKIKATMFGESHGNAVGGVLTGVEAGQKIDLEQIEQQMNRRRSNFAFTTQRVEADQVEIISGVTDGYTNGAPISVVFKNTDVDSSHYNKYIPRPSTADYSAFVKDSGYNDYRGGGHFSARITAPLTFLGNIARQVLESKGVTIGSRIKSIGTITDFSKFTPDADLLKKLSTNNFALLNEKLYDKMIEHIQNAKTEGDSAGGVIECGVVGLPVGIGGYHFESIESKLASVIFGINGVCGVEFGKGFSRAALKGSVSNDQIRLTDGKICCVTNNGGGVAGGFTNGMPLIFSAAFKPAPSISKPQMSVDLETLNNTELTINGRHDACYVPRALAVVEAATAICLLDFMEN